MTDKQPPYNIGLIDFHHYCEVRVSLCFNAFIDKSDNAESLTLMHALII